VQRTCAAAEPGPVTPCFTPGSYGQCVREETEFFYSNISALGTLIMDDDGRLGRGVTALEARRRPLARFRAQKTYSCNVLAMAAPFFSCTSGPTTCYRRRQCHGAACGPAVCRAMEFVQFHPTGILRLGLPDHGKAGAKAVTWTQFRRRTLSWSVMRPRKRSSPSRDVVHARWDTGNSCEARGVGFPKKDHIYLTLEHLGAAVLRSACPVFSEPGKIFRRRRCHQGSASGPATAATILGRHS